jgi:hypothetical protein
MYQNHSPPRGGQAARLRVAEPFLENIAFGSQMGQNKNRLLNILIQKIRLFYRTTSPSIII